MVAMISSISVSFIWRVFDPLEFAKIIHQVLLLTIVGLKYSPSKSIFRKAIRFERKLSRFIFHLLIKIAPLCNFTAVLIPALFNYFIKNLGPNAFNLIYPMWYVFQLNSFWKSRFNIIFAISLKVTI